MVRRYNHNKITSLTCWVGDPLTAEQYAKKFSHCCEGSEPHVRFPSLEIQQMDYKYPGYLTLKPVGLNCRTQDWAETETPKQKHVHQDQGERAVTLQETEPDLPARVEGMLWRCELVVVHQGEWGRGQGTSCPGVSLGVSHSWRSH